MIKNVNNSYHGGADRTGPGGHFRSGGAVAPSRLLILGDSITLGVAQLGGERITAHVEMSYVDILRRELPQLVIHIDADIHRTTADALPRLEPLLERYHPNLVLVMLGGNDADLYWKRFVISAGRIMRHRVAVEQFTVNLQQIVARVRAAGATPILTDMPNHCLALRGPYLSQLSGKDVTAMIAAHGGQATSDASLARYQQAAAAVARAAACPFVAYGQALARYPLENVATADGAHPNAFAHGVIAAEFKPLLAALSRPGASAATWSQRACAEVHA